MAGNSPPSVHVPCKGDFQVSKQKNLRAPEAAEGGGSKIENILTARARAQRYHNKLTSLFKNTIVHD